MTAGSQTPSRQFDWLWWIVLLAVVTLLFCLAYDRWTLKAWQTPISYVGDTWGEMAAAKAFATGEIYPVLPKYPRSFGAPFVANWNDYPITDEAVFCWHALFIRLFGLFTGSNFVLLSAHLLAAASFYFVARSLRYEKTISFATALLFAMSPFAFARSLWHLSLTLYWHVPLGLLVVWWCISGQAYRDRRKQIASVVIAVIHGVYYVYYLGIFAQFLVLAALVCLLRRKERSQVLFPLFLLAVVAFTFALMNLDTFIYKSTNGPNPDALVRNYSGLELYALRPIELFLPASHRLASLQEWTNRVYFSQTMFHRGENNSVYLGFIGLVGLLLLAAASLSAIIKNDYNRIPIHALGAGWVLLFSVIGGLNGFLGAFGIVLFRGTNRYSIVILAIALLFVARQLSRAAAKARFPVVMGCSGLIAIIGFGDQVPRFYDAANTEQIHRRVVSDGRFSATLESKLPARAMVFELPVAGYPEIGPIKKMLDYEHFRPYLQSRTLRYSYGSHKGRPRERWQTEAMQFGVPNAVLSLEKYGFAAILINRKGYADNADSLLAELAAAGKSQVLSESDELVAIALEPSLHPPLPPEFDRQWYALEGKPSDFWRWSSGNARVILYNADSTNRPVHLSFNLLSLEPREIEIALGATKLFAASLEAGRPSTTINLTAILRPGKNELLFKTDRPPNVPRNGDNRKLAFSLRNFTIDE